MNSLRLLFALCLAMPLSAQEPEIVEQVNVIRKILDVRVTDKKGEPIPDLKLSDFQLTHEGKPVPITSCFWIDGSKPQPGSLAEEDLYDFYDDQTPPEKESDPEAYDPFWDDTASQKRTPRGRMIVVFIQDYYGSRALVRRANQVRRFLDNLEEEDHVAVLSWDAQTERLRLHTDFSNEVDTIREAMGKARDKSLDNPLDDGGFPRILPYLPRDIRDDVPSMEMALYHIAEALDHFGGNKTLLMIGLGLGYISPITGAHVTRDYKPAREAMIRARVTMIAWNSHYNPAAFTVDQYADIMKQMAIDTGGFYVIGMPRKAINDLSRTISGYYELAVDLPKEAVIGDKYSLKLVKRKGKILVQSPFNDEPVVTRGAKNRNR